MSEQGNAKVVPLAVTKVDWTGLQSLVQSTYGRNVIQDLNVQNETELFCETLKRLNSNRDSLRHLFLSVGVICDKKIFQSLYDFEYLRLWWDIPNEDDYFVVATGSFDQWKMALEKICRKESEKQIRIVFNKIFLIFERGHAEGVKEFHKTGLPDGSFTIQRRM